MDQLTKQLDDDILGFIRRSSRESFPELRFNDMALRLFDYQFSHNTIYRNFCLGQSLSPDSVSSWEEVPAVPTLAFKALEMACFPVERAVALYISSGTTSGESSRHYLETLDLYNESLRLNFASSVLPEGRPIKMLVLAPSPESMPNSSLAHMLQMVIGEFGSKGSDFYFSNGKLELTRLSQALRAAERDQEPVCLLGTALAFLHFLDNCQETRQYFSLASGSRIMDTGGYKGTSRQVPQTELHKLYERILGISPGSVVNEYGMSELCTQFYDNSLREPGKPRCKLVPPWARTLIIDPETMETLPKGQVGLIRHYDLANRGSAMAVQTDDLGVEIDNGFEILGRAQGAMSRGCSIAIDEMLRGTR